MPLQYIQFLAASVPAKEYAALLPNVSQLAVDFRLPPEVLFQLYRPVLAAARSSQAVAEDGEIGDAGIPWPGMRICLAFDAAACGSYEWDLGASGELSDCA